MSEVTELDTRKFVVVGIDDTVSLVGDRLKYILDTPKQWQKFYDACDEDEPNVPVVRLVQHLSKHYRIVFCTARSETHRDKTHTWLMRYFISPQLLMRPKDDHRSDMIVKPELLEALHLSPDNVYLILEDRTRLAKKWRELGFNCLQVANGDF